MKNKSKKIIMCVKLKNSYSFGKSFEMLLKFTLIVKIVWIKENLWKMMRIKWVEKKNRIIVTIFYSNSYFSQ